MKIMDDQVDGNFEDTKKNIMSIFSEGVEKIGIKKELHREKMEQKVAESKHSIWDFFTGGTDGRELLQKSVKYLQKDRGIIDENFLTPMEEMEKDILHKQDAVPLSFQTRIFRLKKLLEILNETLVAIENFEDEDDIIENMPETMLEDVSKDIFQKCTKLHEYCKANINKDLQDNFSMILGDKEKSDKNCTKRKISLGNRNAKEIETHIAVLHQYIEDILQTLKQIGNDLQKSGIVKAPEKLQHTENIAEDPRVSTVHGFRGHRASVGGRKLSFVGHNAVLVAGTQGQVDMSNAMVADSLLLQMPLKYQAIQEISES